MIAPLFACLVSMSAFATPPSLALYIDHEARKYGVPVRYALALRWAESRGNPFARHPNADGSVDEGPWQFNTDSLPWLEKRLNGGKAINPYNRYQAAHIAIKYLGELYTAYRNWRDVFIAYNAGPGALTSQDIPASTVVYVRTITYVAAE